MAMAIVIRAECEADLRRHGQKRKGRESRGIYPPAFKEGGAELDDFYIARVRDR